MTLVDGGVSRKEVEVFAAFDIPDFTTAGAGKDNGKGMVVESAVGFFALNVFLGSA